MLKHLRLSGCPVGSEHIRCVSCGETTAGGFSPDLGGILVCSQGFSTRKHMENTIVHELLHMYDHCKFKVDWGNLRHHACSEVLLRVYFRTEMILHFYFYMIDSSCQFEWRLSLGSRNE